MAVKMMTPVFRASYVKVWEPAQDDNGNEYYGLSMIFNKDPNALNGLKESDLAKINDAIKQALADKWGKDQAKWPRNLKICLRDADQEDRTNPNLPGYDPAYVNSFFVNAKSKNQPGIVDSHVQPIISQSDFYSGCYARATVVFNAYDKGGGKGVGCYVNNIMKVAEGERLGGAPPAEEDFAQFANIGTAETL